MICCRTTVNVACVQDGSHIAHVQCITRTQQELTLAEALLRARRETRSEKISRVMCWNTLDECNVKYYICTHTTPMVTEYCGSAVICYMNELIKNNSVRKWNFKRIVLYSFIKLILVMVYYGWTNFRSWFGRFHQKDIL